MVASQSNWPHYKRRRYFLNLPNQITIIRICLVPFFVASLFYWSGSNHLFHLIPASIFVLAAMTDGLDGYIATKLNERTPLGRFIDPIADKLLLISAFLGLSFFNGIPIEYRIPVWLTLLVIARDFLLVLGYIVLYVNDKSYQPTPNLCGKATTFFQMSVIAFTLCFSKSVSFDICLIVGVLTCISGALYIKGGLTELTLWRQSIHD